MFLRGSLFFILFFYIKVRIISHKNAHEVERKITRKRFALQ